MRKIFFFLIFSSILFSCAEANPDALDTINVDGVSSEVLLTYGYASSASFSIESAKQWTIATFGLDWASVTPTKGAAGEKTQVSITADVNIGGERSGTIVIYAGNAQKSIVVKQSAIPVDPGIDLHNIEGNALNFAFDAIDPVSFDLVSTGAWQIEKSSLDWLDVSITSGEGLEKYTIVVTPSANSGSVRKGSLTIMTEGAEPVLINVEQAAFAAAPKMEISGLIDNSIQLPAVVTEPVTFQIASNRDWTFVQSVTPDMSWVVLSQQSGLASDAPVTISVRAKDNEGKIRAGIIILKSEDSTVPDILINVGQDSPNSSGTRSLLAQWTLTDSALKQYSGSNWTGKGIMYADLPEATKAFGKWNVVNPSSAYGSATPAYIISSDGNGHYALKHIWTGDNLEFTIPVSDFESGSRVSVRLALSSTGKGPRYWNVEYYDGSSWLPTSTCDFSNANGGTTAATLDLEKANAIKNIDEVALPAVVKTEQGEDVIKIRLVCVDGQYTIDNVISAPVKNATMRIRQWGITEEGVTHDAITFELLR